MARVVSTWPHGTLLPALRSTLSTGNEGLLCVAFANRKGVALLDDELTRLADQDGCRMLLTTVFGGGPTGITAPAVRLGARVIPRCGAHPAMCSSIQSRM